MRGIRTVYSDQFQRLVLARADFEIPVSRVVFSNISVQFSSSDPFILRRGRDFPLDGRKQTGEIDTNRAGFVARGNLYDLGISVRQFRENCSIVLRDDLVDREVVRFLPGNV